jgi:hypothetical protein
MFDRINVGPHELSALKRRREELLLKANLSVWEARELDELDRKLGYAPVGADPGIEVGGTTHRRVEE